MFVASSDAVAAARVPHGVQFASKIQCNSRKMIYPPDLGVNNAFPEVVVDHASDVFVNASLECMRSSVKGMPFRVDRWWRVLCATMCCPFFCLSVDLLASAYRSSSGYVPDQLLCLLKPQIGPDILTDFLQAHSAEVMHRFSMTDRLFLVGLEQGNDVLAEVEAFEASGLFEFAEPDYVIELTRTSNERSIDSGQNWGLNNQGESGGKDDADIDAPELWDYIVSSRSVVIAVVDTGIRYTHEDLAANIWVNPGEIPGNRRDDDRNGVVDDVHGYNAVTRKGDPMDDNGHGTQVAGIIGAVGNNRKGSVGVAWEATMMPLKFLDEEGFGSTSNGILCLEYAAENGADLVNASWGSGRRSRSLQRTIRNLGNSGIFMVTAAGNDNQNLDVEPDYPASYPDANLVVVAATTRKDKLASYSNYGFRSVDIAAPGSSIFSTSMASDRSYAYGDGTSFAAPHVTGAIAILKTYFPDVSYDEILNAMMASVDRVTELLTKTRSGGRLNVHAAFLRLHQQYGVPAFLTVKGEASRSVELRAEGHPFSFHFIEGSTDLKHWISVSQEFADAKGDLKLSFPPQEGGSAVFFRLKSELSAFRPSGESGE